MSADEISEKIGSYIRERFLDGDLNRELEETSPLLEWGVLNSMNTALLLMFIRDELGVAVPPKGINAGNFRDIRSITQMVIELGRPQQATVAGRD
ncbi:acyl carrier protein [Streptomyces hainanensis]|uniref:Acyl carrier protein n=1 Tax=Streptomyces hainanensis TaxID=402648 RepID=A0A4V2Y2H2_9ACTN|nr:acyl carrier protein [Streptomyces hainanensis]TDC72595.1 acyl carrier protein [Streptomyces hainanensis]